MRDLLRPTALLLSEFARSAGARSAPNLRERCRAVVDDFDAALEGRQVAPDVRKEAVYAQCAVLDELALVHLPPEDKQHWEAHPPLQVERFGNHDAGERIYDRIDARMREALPSNDGLLDFYAALLGLGFRGRYGPVSAPTGHDHSIVGRALGSEWPRPVDAGAAEAERASMIAALDGWLAPRPASKRTFIAKRLRARVLALLCGLPPSTIASLGSAAVAMIYLAWGQALDSQLADLLV
jgi:type VI secretion system protein ImpK